MPDRTTVVLPALLKQQAVARAREEGISFGQLVRRALEAELRPTEGNRRRGEATGDPFWDNLQPIEGGPSDVALNHDEYLYGRKR